MQVTSAASAVYQAMTPRKTAAIQTPSDAAATNSASRDGGVSQVDFTHMTRREMLDWVNGEIRAGRMTLKESSPLAMMAFTMNGVDSDTSAHDFMSEMRNAIDGAKWLHDDDLANRFAAGLELMKKYQGQVTRVDMTV